jgi:hypothetical protein
MHHILVHENEAEEDVFVVPDFDEEDINHKDASGPYNNAKAEIERNEEQVLFYYCYLK